MRQFGKYNTFIRDIQSKLESGETVFLVGNVDSVMLRLEHNGLTNVRAERVFKTTPLQISFSEMDGTYFLSGGKKILTGHKIFKVN